MRTDEGMAEALQTVFWILVGFVLDWIIQEMSKPIAGVKPKEWAKHLRPYGRRQFWHAVRRAAREALQRWKTR